MNQRTLVGLSALGLLGACAGLLAASGNQAIPAAKAQVVQAHARLASVSLGDRQDIDYDRLDSRLQQLMRSPAMVGLAVGIVENGRITFLNGYGETAARSGEKVTPETVFRWASVSKGVAGTMVAKLAQDGKIRLDAPVARYSVSLKLPGGAETRATVADLLTHRLGLYRNAYDGKLEGGEDPFALRRELASLSAVCPPGTCWSYQNIAYDAASEMVARVSGRNFAQELKDSLFDPIGMTSASVTREGLMNSPSWARPHSAGRRELTISDAYYKVPAAGGVNSDIKDMALWMIAQMGGMPDVLDDKLLGEIHAPLVRTPTELGRLRKFAERVRSPYYGFGWRSYDYAGHRIVGHRGGVSGYRSLILFDPEKKSGVVAMWNSDTWKPGGLEFEVMDMLHHLPFRDWMELGGDTRRIAARKGQARG